MTRANPWARGFGSQRVEPFSRRHILLRYRLTCSPTARKIGLEIIQFARLRSVPVTRASQAQFEPIPALDFRRPFMAWSPRLTRLFGWCREGSRTPKGRIPADFEGMKSIPFQYHQLLVSASDAGRNKIRVRSISLTHYPVRPLPVTTASQPDRKLRCIAWQFTPSTDST